MMVEAPVRLCCMKRHYGVQCLDGLVMCCICFDRFAVEDLVIDPVDGKRLNVCKPCGAWDRKQSQLICPCGDPTIEVPACASSFCTCPCHKVNDEMWDKKQNRWVEVEEW